jgi:tape measure domain-containing protein
VSVVANVAINVDSRNAVSKLREVQSQAGATERAIGGLGAVVGRLAGAFAAFQAAKFVFVQAAEVESQRRSLEVLTGSAQRAGQIVKELQDLGAVTPFTSSELIDSAKRLQAFGVETSKVVETTRRLADVSGATGAELQGLVTAYGQVQAKGRLQGEELLQFQERGVALQQVLRKEYNLSGEEFQKALEGGRISAQAVEAAIIKLTDAGGKYANGAIAQSDTLNGKLSTLQDSFQRLAQNIGTFFAPVFKFLIDGVNALIERLNTAGRIGAEARAYEEANRRTRTRFGALRYANPFDQEVQQYRERLRKSLVTAEMGAGGAAAAPVMTGGGGLPPLLGATGGKGRGGKSDAEKAAEKAAREAERAAEAAAKEKARVDEVIRSRFAEAEIIKRQSDLRDRISLAERANDAQLVVRLQGAQKELDIQHQYAEELVKEKDLNAQKAIIYQGQVALVASQRDTQRELNKLQLKGDQERFDALQQYIERQYELNTAVQSQLELADGIANTLGQGITSAFDALLTGSEAWGDSLKQIASGVLLDIAKQLLQIFVIEQAINALRGILTPFSAATPIGAGGGQIGRFGTLGPNFGIPQRAKGGPVTGGMPYLVGERGPELFVPGRSGSIVPNHELGGSGVNVVVNVDAKGTNVQGNDQQGNQLGRAVSAAVQAELVKQKRPGGLLA